MKTRRTDRCYLIAQQGNGGFTRGRYFGGQMPSFFFRNRETSPCCLNTALQAPQLPRNPVPSRATLSCFGASGIPPPCDARTATSAAALQHGAPPDEVLRPARHLAVDLAVDLAAARGLPRWSCREVRASLLPSICPPVRLCPSLRGRGPRLARRAAGARARRGRRRAGAPPAAPTAPCRGRRTPTPAPGGRVVEYKGEGER